MSVCISRHGEFSSHILDPEYTCLTCGVLDEDALRGALRLALLAAARASGGAMLPTLDETRSRRVPLGGTQALAFSDFTSTDYDGNDHQSITNPDRANLITSLVDPINRDPFGPLLGSLGTHKIVIDIDMPCELVPSSTPGHFHLFIDHTMEWEAYVTLLGALAEAGIVEPGYVGAAIARGHTAVRLPWVSKGDTPPECTHGADCPLHPRVNALHNFDAR